MKQVYTAADLHMRILSLQAKSTQQEEELKESFAGIKDSLKPMNLIKNTFGNTVKSPGFGKNLLKGGLGLAAGLLSKKLFVMGSSNMLKKALGTIVEVGVAKAVSGNAEKITSSGLKILQKVKK